MAPRLSDASASGADVALIDDIVIGALTESFIHTDKEFMRSAGHGQAGSTATTVLPSTSGLADCSSDARLPRHGCNGAWRPTTR